LRLQATHAGEPAGVYPSITYRPDIDGLRAIAITMVIAYHAFPGMLPGGFTGVDVFFVISGYLITQLVLTDLQRETFSLLGFYQRRVRRIVPALLVVLAACFAVAWLTLLPGEFRWFGRSVLWSAPFLANVFFAHVTGYFDPGAHYNVLLHLWSLGVEEQFYLAWPILLLLAMRYDVTMRALGAVVAASFAISVWGAHTAPIVHFFLPGARAWELAIGAMLAARQLGAPRAAVTGNASSGTGPWGSYRRWVPLAALALIAAGALLLTADDMLPGAWALIPTTGAALLIAAGPHSLVNRRFLAATPLVLVGQLSYSLYLWHWPLFVFARAIWGQELPPAMIAGVIAITCAAAWVTYHLVETPMRRGALGQRAFPTLLAGLAGFTALGSLTTDGHFPGRLSGPQFAAWEAAVDDWDITSGGSLDERRGFEILTQHSRRAATTLFIGDSHMQQYWPRVTYLVHTYPDKARSVLFMGYAGCPILPGVNSLRQPRDCDSFFTYATAQAFQPQIDTVVFGAFWELYLLGEFSLEEHQGIYSTQDLLRRQLRLDSRGTQIALEQFERQLVKLVSSGRRVFIVLSNPTSPQFDPPALVPSRVRLSLGRPGVFAANPGRYVDAAPFEAFVAPLMNRLREVAVRAGAQVIDPRSTLCAGMMCPAVAADGTPLFIDSNHLRASFAREQASFLDETLLLPETH
jgi:peptidoglycan/LPS O-acetylase OafA/YrhL